MRYPLKSLSAVLWCVLLAILLNAPPGSALAEPDTGNCVIVSPDTLSFNGDICRDYWLNVDSQWLDIIACPGDTGLFWWAGAGESWVVLQPDSGLTPASVMVTIDWSKVPIPFTPPDPGDTIWFETYVDVYTNDYSERTVILLGEYCEPGSGTLVAEPAVVEVSAEPGQTVEASTHIREQSGDTLELGFWTATPWISLPVFIEPPTTPTDLAFTISTEGLSPGTYYGDVIVYGYDSSTFIDSVVVPVHLTVDSGGLQVMAQPHIFYLSQSGGPSVTEHTLVYEVGGSTLPFWAETALGSEWLNIHPPDSSFSPMWYTPDTVEFDVSSAGLSPGSYTDTIIIYNPFDDTLIWPDVRVPVNLTVTDSGAPYLAVFPTSFTYTGGWHHDTLQVWDVSGDTIPFTVSDKGVPWLTIDPAPDSFWYTPASVTFNVHEDTLPTGTYYDTLFVRSSAASNFVDVPVKFTVPGNMPYLLYSDPYLVKIFASMDGYQTQASVTILDTLGRAVPFGIYSMKGLVGIVSTDEPPYMTPQSFDLFFGAITDTGLFTDSLVVYPVTDTAQFDSLLIPVQMFVYPNSFLADVQTRPTSIQVTLEQGVHDVRSLYVEERWQQNVPFWPVASAPWLMVNTFQMPPYVTPEELILAFSADSLDPGEYHDTLWIYPDTDGVSFEPEPVPITLNVESLTLDVRTVPDWFDFALMPGDSAIGASFLVYETHGFELAYGTRVAHESAWLRLWPSIATNVIPTMPDSVFFDVITEGLEPGWYHDTIVVFDVDSSDWGPVYVPVSLSVDTTSQYILDTDPSIFSWNLAPGDSLVDDLIVFEKSGASIGFWTWNASSWLYLDTIPLSPLVTPETIPVHVSAANLSPGVYYDTIRVESSESQNSTGVLAILTVGDTSQPQIIAEPNNVSFTLNNNDTVFSSIYVYEASGRGIPFYYGTALASPWLKIHYPAITVLPETPDSIIFSVTPVGLAPGAYSDTIVIFDPLDTDGLYWSNVKVPVVLFVDTNQTGYVVRTEPEALNLSAPLGGTGRDSLLVFEQSGQNVDFLLYWSSSWLHVEPIPPQLAPFTTPLSFHVYTDTLGMPAVLYDTVVIQPIPAPGWPWFPTVRVPVTFEVGSGISADSLYVPSSVVQAGEASYQWVGCHLTQSARGATVPLKIPDGVEVLAVQFDSLITEGWDYNIVDVKPDSGFIVVVMANSFNAYIPPGYQALFKILYRTLGDIPCHEDMTIRWDTALSYDPSRQLKFADLQHNTFVPGFDYWRDSVNVVGTGGGNSDGVSGVDIGDLTYMISFMLLGGPAAENMNMFDVNNDCAGPDIGDLTYLISYLYLDGDPPHCGCITQNWAAAYRTASGIEVQPTYENGFTTLELVTDRPLRGLQIQLEGGISTGVENLAGSQFDLLQGRFEGTPQVALVDLDGGAMVSAGRHQVVRFEGIVEIGTVLVSDENHDVFAASLSSSGGELVPGDFALRQNYPNPFNPTTDISYTLPEAAQVRLDVFNVMGQKVATLVDEYEEAGEHTVTWDGRTQEGQAVASGIYLYRLEAGARSATRKMMLLK
jgi:hypothetical protein